MENQVEKVFVKVNQTWQKGEATSTSENMFKVKVPNYQEFEIDKKSSFLERQQFPAQKFAYSDVKERLEGAYVSFDKLPENIQDSLVRGEEYLHQATYVNEGKLKESVKIVQMMYSQSTGSKLDVQIKRNEPVQLDQAKAYNHQFSKQEFEAMVQEGKTIQFMGKNSAGGTFPKLAYYEPKLNDIRTKSALSENTYFFGQKLTQEQAATMNMGKEVEITIDTKKGEKTYMVSWSPRAERFVTKTPENAKVKGIEVKPEKQENKAKKKDKGQAISM